MIFHQPFNSLSGYQYNIKIWENVIWNSHFHKNFELIYVMDGKLNCTINGKSEMLNKGDFALCLSNEVHSLIPENDARYLVCVFSEEYIKSVSKQFKGKTGSTFKFNCRDTVKNFYVDSMTNIDSPSIFTLKACLYAVCDEYLNYVSLEDVDNSKTDVILTIINFVENNFKKNISLRDISALLGYEYHYTSSLFRKLFNMSFNEFVNLYRLEAAIGLLENDFERLVDIAYESGFQSVRNFNNCFKKNFGISPTEYKKQPK